jgi:hypothetical protein
MTKKMMIGGAMLLALAGNLQAGAVYSPAPGVICDKKSHFCADKEGIAYGMTQEYLGEAALAKFQKMTSGAGDSFDTTVFTMSNGLHCDAHKKICKKSKWDDKPDPHWTKILFGHMPKGHAAKKHHTGAISTEMIEAEKMCKNHIAEKYGLPMAAARVYPGKVHNGVYTIPVRFKWDEPRVDERGSCKVDGDNVSYHRTSD